MLTLEEYADGQILAFDKPLGWTSFDVVAKVRYHLCRALGVKKLKVGHAGTLDPLATGVLLLCTGRATKRIDELQAGTKEYVATLFIGATTPSFDREQPIDAIFPTSHITRQSVEHTLASFSGTIQQVPPAFSACKVDGDRAYDLARRGEQPALRAKTLVIDHICLEDYREGVIAPPPTPLKGRPAPATAHEGVQGIEATIRVVCSKGTYIRALARDIGTALGSGAHLTALRRTRIGDATIGACLDVEAFVAALPTPHTATTQTSA